MELTPSIPILAKIEVSAAKTEEASANTNHIVIPPIEGNRPLIQKIPPEKVWVSRFLGGQPEQHAPVWAHNLLAVRTIAAEIL